jgi:hypothetical protein
MFGCAGGPPVVFEKDVLNVRSLEYCREHPEALEQQILRFELLAGNEVEGEVASPNGDNLLRAWVNDPGGNCILNTTYGTVQERAVSTQEYPWRFTFIVSATGEYNLTLYNDKDGEPVAAHLKVTTYHR